MTRRDSLKCIHEPFGDAFYYGPERLSSRFEDDEKARFDSGFQNSTYKTIVDRIEKEGAEVRITPPSPCPVPGTPYLRCTVFAGRCGLSCSEHIQQHFDPLSFCSTLVGYSPTPPGKDALLVLK